MPVRFALPLLFVLALALSGCAGSPCVVDQQGYSQMLKRFPSEMQARGIASLLRSVDRYQLLSRYGVSATPCWFSRATIRSNVGFHRLRNQSASPNHLTRVGMNA